MWSIKVNRRYKDQGGWDQIVGGKGKCNEEYPFELFIFNNMLKKYKFTWWTNKFGTFKRSTFSPFQIFLKFHEILGFTSPQPPCKKAIHATDFSSKNSLKTVFTVGWRTYSYCKRCLLLGIRTNAFSCSFKR